MIDYLVDNQRPQLRRERMQGKSRRTVEEDILGDRKPLDEFLLAEDRTPCPCAAPRGCDA
jgi:hypothetical protein